ncbi:MAG: oligosaccharide flippase family protein [Candidatus Helarchaeota archaeon]
MLKQNFPKLVNRIKSRNHKTALAAITYGSSSVITQAIMVIYMIIVAKWLGAEKYGYIAAAYASISLSAFLFNWGFNQYLMKTGSTTSKPEELGGRVIFIKGILGLVWGVLLFFILKIIRPDLYIEYILILTIVDIWLDSQFGTLIAILLLLNKAKLASVLLVSSRLVRLLSILALIFFSSESILFVLLLRLLTSLIAFIVTWTIIKPPLVNITWYEIRKLFKQSMAFNTSELLSIIYINADVNILIWLGADSKSVANYSVVISLINAIITLPSGIYNVILPSLVRSYYQERLIFIRRVRIVYACFIILAIGLWMSVTQLSRPLITTFLGKSYSESIPLLIGLSLLLGLRTINQANIAYLISVGWQMNRLLPQLIVLIMKIVLGLYAVSQFQSQGMIIITTIAEFLLVILYITQVIRHKSLSNQVSYQ